MKPLCGHSGRDVIVLFTLHPARTHNSHTSPRLAHGRDCTQMSHKSDAVTWPP